MKIQKHTKLHALTISHACIYIYLLFILNETLQTDSKSFATHEEDIEANQQVIFEKRGNFITSATYIHVHINIPILPFMKRLESAIERLGQFSAVLAIKIADKRNSATDSINSKITEQALIRIRIIYQDMYEATLSLPVNSKDTRQIVPISLALLGTFGTIFGVFNKAQIDQIRTALLQTNKKVNLLVDVAELNTKHISNLEIRLDSLSDLMADFIENSPALLDSSMELLIFSAVRSANIIHSAIQQAQNHRLSTQLLDSETLKQIFSSLQDRAYNEKADLIISNPSDLYQLDVSFINLKSESISIIIHVPMARRNQVFNLYQHLPIPLAQSFTTNLTITPKWTQT